MSFIYKGFSTEAMLNIMADHENTTFIELVSLGKKAVWKLTIHNDKHANFEDYGTIARLLIKAFEPYYPEARATRDEWSNFFDYLANPQRRTPRPMEIVFGVDWSDGSDYSVETKKCKHGTILYGVNCLQCARERKHDK